VADKRTFARLRKRLLASFEVDGRTVAGFTIDLSHTGLLVSSFHLPRIGEQIRLVLQLPSGKKIECVGRVVRARRLPPELSQGAGSVFGVALEGYFEEYARLVSDGQ
jgi:hypothetical protein